MNSAEMQVEPLAADNKDDLSTVVALGDLCRDRLGQLPYAVFTEAAIQSRILIARQMSGGPLLGYALYRLPRNEISLTHLCVRDGARGQGVARALVDAISSRHSDRLGLRAKCRDDYDLNGTWRSLGFQPRASTVGRGRDRAPMTVWWKDHGHPDLFTEYEQPVDLRAAIDLNIVRDLATPGSRNHRSDFLVADHLAGRLELVVTSGMRAEINHSPLAQRRPLLQAIDPYPLMNANPTDVATLRGLILEDVQLQSPGYPASHQDHSDLVQVAHAAAAGVSAFLTWDDSLIKRLGRVVERLTGMKVMAPDYVVVHLDELADAEGFRKQSLDGSEFSRVRAGSRVEDDLDAFLAKSAGERRRDLRDRVRQLAHDGHAIELVHSENGAPLALYGVVATQTKLTVPLLRLADHLLADTLARHLLWTFRRQARVGQAILVDITEPYLSARLVQAADFESMIHVPGHRYAPVVDVCGSSAEVVAAANVSFALDGLGASPLLASRLSPHAAARLEHAWWPAKIMDSDLPNYVVPIRSAFAFELFGYPEGMTARDIQLSLGREHVYYHSARNSVLTAPARILWLATTNGPGGQHFFAVSTLDDLVTDTPERLHAALHHYGVFDLSAITAAARNAPTAEALRLPTTELFPAPVPMRRYQAYRTQLATGPQTFYSARRLDRDLFAALYRDGAQRPRATEP